jgi:hypothetical protein
LGSNSDGVWSKTAATIQIRITPPFWKTWWFRLLVVIMLAAIIYFYNRQRLNRVVKQKRFLENQIRERTATVMKQKEEIEAQKSIIEEQKKKTESLVHSILPKETAEELINKGFSRPRNYSMCTVMFTDFQGFTKIAEKLRPQQLIDELDNEQQQQQQQQQIINSDQYQQSNCSSNSITNCNCKNSLSNNSNGRLILIISIIKNIS